MLIAVVIAAWLISKEEGVSEFFALFFFGCC